MSNLTILNTSIRVLNDLYSLNDLHAISGNNPKHRPNQFIRLETTKDLINEIETENLNAQICAIKTLRGTTGGSYACKELVIAYAAWISPAFHLVVLRAFLNQIEPQQPAFPSLELTYSQSFSQTDINHLVWLLFSHEKMRFLLENLYKPLALLDSPFAPKVYGCVTEYKRIYKTAKPLIKKLLDSLQRDNPEQWRHLTRYLNNEI
ncbi:hypothetical protein BKK51_06890 [Rodentibacter trehalosifermentans]|uniref:KilA-N domain-containing protein n=1 Tax=Rodentibacter trehalosifermentans TaxID=1908263 RepID=A0A1V3ISL7_9PAST|nr:KilA-N domain-containing protein [Rodentibacter trehalosifermentans]OOF45272.1 hypothetical protein BKK51_06890 [Rodentibacter trehalosifermentans]